VAAGRPPHHLIDAGRAIALGRLVIEGRFSPIGIVRVPQLQVDLLVLLVVGAGERQIGEPVEGDDAVGLRIGDRL
jgi:hypothetical protein